MNADDYCDECKKPTTWCLCDTFVIDTEENLIAVCKGLKEPEEFPRKSRRREIEEFAFSA